MRLVSPHAPTGSLKLLLCGLTASKRCDWSPDCSRQKVRSNTFLVLFFLKGLTFTNAWISLPDGLQMEDKSKEFGKHSIWLVLQFTGCKNNKKMHRRITFFNLKTPVMIKKRVNKVATFQCDSEGFWQKRRAHCMSDTSSKSYGFNKAPLTVTPPPLIITDFTTPPAADWGGCLTKWEGWVSVTCGAVSGRSPTCCADRKKATLMSEVRMWNTETKKTSAKTSSLHNQGVMMTFSAVPTISSG